MPDSPEYSLLDKVAISCSETLRGKALTDLALKTGDLLGILKMRNEDIHKWLCRYKRSFEGKDLMYSRAEAILKDCRHKDIHVVYLGDENYPLRLREIYKAPLILYYKGEIPPELLSWESEVLAMVGTRHVEGFVRDLVCDWATYLTQRGVHIISGMALGTDAMAHWGALRVGKTSAVLGGGVDVIYPYGNNLLYRKILDGGGVIFSEHPPGTRPMAYHFPMRNRIISGLSDGVFLAQSQVKGGGMITVRYAIEDNRNVFVYGGESLRESFSGNRSLIEQGACAVHTKEALAKQLGFEDEKKTPPISKLNEVETRIMEALSMNRLTSLVELSRRLVMTTDTLSAILLKMVLKGFIGESSGKRYFKKMG